jgi:hypothetical protein
MTQEEKVKICKELQQKHVEAQEHAVRDNGNNFDYYKGVVEGIWNCIKYIRRLETKE